MKQHAFNSVWDALEDTPQEVENMKIRSSLMIAISSHLKKSNATPATKAKQLGITQPRLNDLLKGRINEFSIDALVANAANAGLKISIRTTAV